MNRTHFAAAAALTLMSPLAAFAQAASTPAALPDLDGQVRCAALFALIAAQQTSKVAGADRFPPLAERGRDFFVSTGLRLIDERKMAPEQMQPYFMAQIAVIRTDHARAADPARQVDAEMSGCLKLLEQTPPPPPRS